MSKEIKTIPMHLQLFAESAEENAPETVVEEQEVKPEETVVEEPKEPTVQELMNELAKVKKAQEKAASEAAEYKKKYNATLSEKEKASIEKAEKEAEREEEWNKTVRENKIFKLEKEYLGIMKYTASEAERMAIAEVDDDKEAKIKIMAEVEARKHKEYEAEFIKNRPPVQAGSGGGEEPEDAFVKGFSSVNPRFKANKK